MVTKIAYIDALEQLCKRIKPKRVLEYGSGKSTHIFAKHAEHVDTIEYDPPNNWDKVPYDNVTFHFINHETGKFPENLLRKIHYLLFDTYGYDGQSLVIDGNGKFPYHDKYDLAFSDGGNWIDGDREAGFGDLSMMYRMTFAGACMCYIPHIVVDDIRYMDFPNVSSEIWHDRMLLLSVKGQDRGET